MFLVLFVLWSAHLTWLARVFQCLGAVDDQNFGTRGSTTEDLGVGTFPWGALKGDAARTSQLLFYLFG